MNRILFLPFLLIPICCQLPIIAIPGLNDNCGNGIFSFLASNLKNPVHCFDPAPDSQTWYTSAQKQIDSICNFLDSNKDTFNLTNGFYFFGVSQGGLWSRMAVQECETGKYAKRLITMGAPHQGVAKIPNLNKDVWYENMINSLGEDIIYWDLLQNTISPAGYFHSLPRHEAYLKSKAILPVFNCEIVGNKCSQYQERLSNLEQFVMVMFDQDTTIIPKESAHFGFYKDALEKEILDFTQLPEFTKLGLDKLQSKGGLFMIVFPGPHVAMPHDLMIMKIFPHFS